ncbi:hypothetical protein ACLMJK_007014 [Lecanora helva]
MPRASLFEKIPPFPEDVAVAELSQVSLWKLWKNDTQESERLFQACRETGFFLLDLTSFGSDEGMLNDAEETLYLSQRLFELEQEQLDKCTLETADRFLYGYKRIGKNKLEDGSPDGVEIYAVSQDDLLGNTSQPRPNVDLIWESQAKVQAFFHHAHSILCHLMSHLDKHLRLPPGTLSSFCPQNKPSNTLLRMLRCPPQTGLSRTNLTGHTDVGTMTMLFNVLGGLQILPPSCANIDKNWRYVRPQPGCAIINIGDAMVQWSGGVLRSNIHRVSSAPGSQASHARYSMAYLLRPELDAPMQRLRGDGVIPPVADGEEEERSVCKEWEQKKSALIVVGKSVPKSLGGNWGGQRIAVQ